MSWGTDSEEVDGTVLAAVESSGWAPGEYTLPSVPARIGPFEKLAEVTDFIADMGTWDSRLDVWA